MPDWKMISLDWTGRAIRFIFHPPDTFSFDVLQKEGKETDFEINTGP